MGEFSLMERIAYWLESQGACVTSTNLLLKDGEVIISAVIDTNRTEVIDPAGTKELHDLFASAESALKLDPKVLPSTLEVVAKNMARSVMRLKRLSRKRGPDYFFDLFTLLDREGVGDGIQGDGVEARKKNNP